MGKLDTSRMSNATKLNKVDDAHVALEGDLEEIFGIPDNTDITQGIFESVNEDGSIGGVVRLFQAGASSTAADCVGIQFEDDTSKKRMIFVDSAVQIYEWNTTTSAWDLKMNMESPGSGKLVDMTDVDTTDMAAGYFLAVNVTNDGFIFVAPASASGISTYAELDDTPDAYDGSNSFDSDDIGKFVVVESGTKLGLAEAPSGLGDPSIYWIVSPAQWDALDQPDPSSISWVPQPLPDEDQDSWSEMWLWQDVVIPDAGLLSEIPLSDDGNQTNKLITLPVGAYEISFWYTSTGYSEYGIREWRVNSDAATIVGPATYGSNQRANVFYPPDVRIQPAPGVQWLGTRTAIQRSATPFWFEARQTAGVNLQGTVFWASIHRIK